MSTEGLIDLEVLSGILDAAELDEMGSSPRSHMLPAAVAQLAIMCATPPGQTPDTIAARLSQSDIFVVYGAEGLYSALLTEDENKHVPAATYVVGLLAAHLHLNESSSRISYGDSE